MQVPYFILVLIPVYQFIKIFLDTKMSIFWGIWSLSNSRKSLETVISFCSFLFWLFYFVLFRKLNHLRERSLIFALNITKTRLFKYTEHFNHQKMKIFRKKKSDISHTSGQNIYCRYSLEPPRRGGSNEYPQSMFLSRNKKNNVYPCKLQFYYIKAGFKGVNII